MQYKKQLEKLNLSEVELTPRLKGMIQDLKKAASDKAELQKNLDEETYENDDEKQELETAIAEIEELITDLDGELYEKLALFGKNRRAKENRESKVQNAEGGAAVPEKQSQPQKTDSKPVSQNSQNEPKEVKKSSSGLLWGILGVGALFLTLGSVNLFSADE